jgi:hypothetical protein
MSGGENRNEKESGANLRRLNYAKHRLNSLQLAARREFEYVMNLQVACF